MNVLTGKQRDIFVSSDHHFNHANILGFTTVGGSKFRGDLFDSVEEMNEVMVERHNAVVGSNDIWYCLGDVYFGHRDDAAKILPRLNGKKRLILGNHDDGKCPVLQHHFEKVMLWRFFKEFDCLLSHTPQHESNLYKVTFNVHGHIHQNESPSLRHVNACVEKTGYAPVNLEQLMTDHKLLTQETFG
jgi:calcineurin-like phosphoesterase family protein